MECGTKMRRKLSRVLAQASSTTPEEVDKKVVRNLIGGINTELSPEDIADNEFIVADNVELRQSRISPRLGFDYYLTKPDSNKVLGFNTVRRYSATTDILRFTKSSIHKVQSGAWVAITGAARTGGDYDSWTVVTVEDRIFASNGIQDLIELNLTANTYADAGNARAYKYYCAANRRICAANLVSGTPSPIEFATCGNRNYTEWDPAVDISAYRNPMVDSEDGTSDEITGLIALKDNVIVIRERSVWLGEPQPIASAPFAFRKVISGVGCTCPPSVQKVGDDKIIWYDVATKEAYMFKLNVNGVEFNPISTKVVEDLHLDMQDTRYITSAYNPQDDEYELLVSPPGTGLYKSWKYCLMYNSWVTHTSTKFNRIWYVYIPTTSGSISSLGTTPIEDLSGTIAGLSSTVNNVVAKIAGTTDGFLGIETVNNYRDLGFSYRVQLKSKNYSLPGMDQSIISLDLDIKVQAALTMVINYYTDRDVATPIRTYTRTVSYVIPPYENTKIQKFKNNVLCSQFCWGMYVDGVNTPFSISGYILRRVPAGEN